MKIKICGMKFPENIKVVAALEPDFLGFIFWEQSPRYFSGPMPELPNGIEKTGVFVDEAFKNIIEKATQYGLSHIQLHGREMPELAEKLQSEGLKVIKAFGIDAGFNPEQLPPFEAVTDYFLFDAKGKWPGGNGTTFDWELLSGLPTEKPVFLSGGIGLEHAAIIKNSNINVFAVDINSRFEDAPGLKNAGLLHEFKNKIT